MRIYYSDIKDKITSVPRKVKDGFGNFIQKTRENTDLLGYVFVPLIGSAVGIASTIVEAHVSKESVKMMDRQLTQYEDPTTHVIFLLKRPMTSAESITLATCVRSGRPAEQVLQELDLL